jgi:hypothetical protein
MNTADNTQLLIELENNLKKQIELARKGNLVLVHTIAGQSEGLVKNITAARLLESSEHKQQRQRIETLYHDLHLLLSSHKDAIEEQLKFIHRGRKTLAVYRGNV